MEVLLQAKVLQAIIALVAIAGVVTRLFSWVSYKRLEKATANMNNSKNAFTRRIKLKFENCYKLNLDIKNIAAFVEKYVRGYRQSGIPLVYFEKTLQVVAVLIGIVAISGAFLQYINGFEMRAVSEVIMTGILGELIVLLFEIVFDTKSLPDRISVNLEEYLENVFSRRLQLEYDDVNVKPVISDEEIYQMGDVHTAASKVKLKKSRKPEPEVSEEETVIREIIKEFLC